MEPRGRGQGVNRWGAPNPRGAHPSFQILSSPGGGLGEQRGKSCDWELGDPTLIPWPGPSASP